jgi:citrate synthase
MIVLADHELNASTFTARAAASTRSDLYAAVAAALAALQGPLHGGTFVGVAQLFAGVASPAEAEAYVRQRLAAGLWLPGFGHTVYPGGDPRAPLLREVAAALAGAGAPDFAVARQIEEAVVRHGGPRANADFYAGAIFQRLGFPPALHPALFAVARSAGWIAHVLEQYAQNRLLRPRARYTGPPPRPWEPAPDGPARPRARLPTPADDRNQYWICGSD